MTTPIVSDSRPEPIDRVHWTYPRAVQVRENNNIKEFHSAVYGTMAVYTESVIETQILLDNWEEIMSLVNQKIKQLIDSQ